MFITDFWSDSYLLLGCVAAIATASPLHAAENYTIGECQTATQSVGTEISPTSVAGIYLTNYHGDDPRYKVKLDSGEFFSGAKVTLVKAPAHGKVAYTNDPDAIKWSMYNYIPNNGYIGRDNFVMLVEKDGVEVRIEYLIEGLTDDDPTTVIGDDGERQGIYCQPEHWKISINTSAATGYELTYFNSASQSHIKSIT